jgi:protein TonB
LSLSDLSGLENSPAPSKLKSISTSAATGKAASGTSSTASLKAAPVARTPDHEPAETQAAEQPAQVPVPTSGEVLAMQATVSAGGSATRSNFTASAVPAGHSAMRPIVSETPNPETVLSAKLIKRVDPIYPELARSIELSGNVVLNAHIDESGKVGAVQAISGDPVLVHAAVDAVRQWEYRPSLVNGQPRPSNARIAINFSLR